MKKSTIAVPVAIALLSFGVSTQSMALEIEDVVVPVATGQDSTAVGVNDTLNDNKLLSDNELKDVGNEEEASVDDGKFNAVANNGSKAEVELDKSVNIKIKDIKVNVLTSNMEGKVSDNKVGAFDNDQKVIAIGNKAEAENEAKQEVKVDQEAKSFQINKSYQKIDQDQDLDADQEIKQYTTQKSDKDIKQYQSNKEAALNASLQAQKSDQDNDAVGVNVPVGVNVNEADGDDTATSGAAGGDADANDAALALQANKSDDPTNKADQDNKAKQDQDADLKNKQGDQKNVALIAEKSKQDQDVEAENGDIDQKAKAKAENDSDQDNKSFQANTALTKAELAQLSKADASVNTAQVNISVIKTGDNTLSGMTNAVGIMPVAQNTGVNSLIQQSVNVQANIYR